MNNPKTVSLIKEQHKASRVPKEIKQFYLVVSDETDKFNAICKTLDDIDMNYGNDKKILVFVRTKKNAEKLSQFLKESLEKKVRETTGYQKAKTRQQKLIKKGIDLGTKGKMSIKREESHARR